MIFVNKSILKSYKGKVKMTFAEKLYQIRRESGMSQEQLAAALGVSRQSVSKWEAGASMPELSKILQLSELFMVTTDYLLKESEDRKNFDSVSEENYGSRQQDEIIRRLDRIEKRERERTGEYEYISEKRLWGMPLVHIHFKWTKGYRNNMIYGFGMQAPGIYMDFSTKAKGIIAIGNHAIGLLSIGYLEKGLFSVGLFSIGLFSVGVICLGLLALGVLSMGAMAAGVVAIGYVALGVTAIGTYGTGVVAMAAKAATGVVAVARTAIGSSDVDGTYTALVSDFSDKKDMLAFLMEHQSGMPKWIGCLLTMFTKM